MTYIHPRLDNTPRTNTLYQQVDSTRHLHQMPEVGSSVSASPKRSHPDPVSSHILDTSLGLPARGVLVTMFAMGGEQAWTKLQSR